jgi:hypothetical protein
MPINLIKDPWWKRPKTKLWVVVSLPLISIAVIAWLSVIAGICLLGVACLAGYAALMDVGQAGRKR